MALILLPFVRHHHYHHHHCRNSRCRCRRPPFSERYANSGGSFIRTGVKCFNTHTLTLCAITTIRFGRAFFSFLFFSVLSFFITRFMQISTLAFAGWLCASLLFPSFSFTRFRETMFVVCVWMYNISTQCTNQCYEREFF